MKFNEIYEIAKTKGITELQITTHEEMQIQFKILKNALDEKKISKTTQYNVKGIVDGKIGNCSTESLDSSIIDQVLNAIVNNAKCVDFEVDEEFCSDKNLISNVNDSPVIDFTDLIEKYKSMYDKLTNFDSRISSFEMCLGSWWVRLKIENSLGLLKEHSRHLFSGYFEVNATEGEKVTSEDDIICSKKLEDYENLIMKTAEKAIKALHPSKFESGKYNVIMDGSVVRKILPYIFAHFDAEEVQNNKSIYNDKVDTKIANEVLSIIEDPTNEDMLGCRIFDNDGVNTYKKDIIKDGILKTYLYDMKSAKKAGRESTGNKLSDYKMTNVYIVPGDNNFNKLLESVNNGIYIHDVQGTHSGIKSETGEISLSACGFIISNGKLGEYVNEIIMSTDFNELLNNIVEVGNDLRNRSYTFSSPSLVVKDINIVG